MLRDRLLLACSLSLILHVSLLALPSGRISHLTALPGKAYLPGERGFASLNVFLEQVALQTPQYSATSKFLPISAIPQSAPTIAAAANENDGGLGNLGEQRGGKDSSDVWSVTGIPVPYYYRPEELSQRAHVAVDIDPFLGSLKELPGNGKAVLTLWINEHGTIDRVERVSSSLDDLFESAVLSQFQSMRFQPAERSGVPVKSLMKIEIELLPPSGQNQSE
jgi:TonB family protein